MTYVGMGAAAVLSPEAGKDWPLDRSSTVRRLGQVLVLPLRYSWTLFLITLTHIDFFFLPEDELPHPSLI